MVFKYCINKPKKKKYLTSQFTTNIKIMSDIKFHVEFMNKIAA